MKIKEILSDSLKYPISDWKKFLIFGIFSVLGGININYYFSILSTTNVTIPLLEIINFIFIILIIGIF
ncbi:MULTISPECIES: hypothetical protein [Methanobacterium]|jgi:hypothetical protein|uniref:Region of a membrane-bound protein predicted to be embedded in the membrane n=1 Tax=Methanobacterium congolense TaxID=118062 RepID=A0A1D3L0P4_9EURY|nr:MULTISPECIES: hypothetical protein [Methanobacterium]SCG85231.1 Region of a membrane-bound protein predicted to be embedded in the membrane [Methanobacterium congolense]